MGRSRDTWLRTVGHVGALTPAAVLIWQAISGVLGPDPIREAVLRTGRYAAVILLLSLVPTVVRIVSGYGGLFVLRRLLGLYAFKYALVHLALQVALDYAFDVGLYFDQVLTKRYGLVGLASLLLLVPLAVTSTAGWIKRLGRTWRRLHRLVYLAAALDVLHYVWTVKADRRVPYVFALVLAVELLLRLPPVQALFVRRRKALS